MSKRIYLSSGPVDLPDDQDPHLFLLGKIAQGQEDLAHSLDLLRRDLKELRDAMAAKIASLDTELGILSARFKIQVKSCDARIAREQALRRPWYNAVVGVVVAAAAGLLGALASLVLGGRP